MSDEPIHVDGTPENADWIKRGRRTADEVEWLAAEAVIYRIREGLHTEYPARSDPKTDRVLITLLESGKIEGGVLPDGKLAFRKAGGESTIGAQHDE